MYSPQCPAVASLPTQYNPSRWMCDDGSERRGLEALLSLLHGGNSDVERGFSENSRVPYKRANLSLSSVNGIRHVMSYSKRVDSNLCSFPINSDVIKTVKGYQSGTQSALQLKRDHHSAPACKQMQSKAEQTKLWKINPKRKQLPQDGCLKMLNCWFSRAWSRTFRTLRVDKQCLLKHDKRWPRAFPTWLSAVSCYHIHFLFPCSYHSSYFGAPFIYACIRLKCISELMWGVYLTLPVIVQ